MRSVPMIALILCLVVVTPVAAGACGTDARDPDEGPTIVTYTNDEYGFSLTHSGRFTRAAEATAESDAGAEELFEVSFMDADGTMAGDVMLDGFNVAVYGLARTVKPAEVPGLRAEIEDLVQQMGSGLQDLDGGSVDDVTVNGVPGFRWTYTYTQDGVALRARATFLFEGAREYLLTVQAAADRWSGLEADLLAVEESFTVE